MVRSVLEKWPRVIFMYREKVKKRGKKREGCFKQDPPENPWFPFFLAGVKRKKNLNMFYLFALKTYFFIVLVPFFTPSS